MAALYDIPAPAKLNLFLHVTGRRPDGYHNLQTVFRFIGLYDYLDIERRSDGRIEREGAIGCVPAHEDLVVRAAERLQHATGTSYGAQIRYTKSIPIGGGLGGGSSNAASTLIALNRLWDTGLSRVELQRLAAPLGADIPVFIYGQAAFAQGRGDELFPVVLPDASYLVVQPKATLKTADVFMHADLTRNTRPVTIADFTDWQDAFCGQSNKQTLYFGRNDLESAAFALSPTVANVGAWLALQGYPARMTGSGACFFVSCSSAHRAVVAQQKISGKMDRASSHCKTPRMIQQMWVCPGLQDHPLRHWMHR